jgi:hypothetical protein
MKNRQNTPDLDKCAVLLMRALEFAERVGFEANRGIVTQPPPPSAPPPNGRAQFGGGQVEKSVVVS